MDNRQLIRTLAGYDPNKEVIMTTADGAVFGVINEEEVKETETSVVITLTPVDVKEEKPEVKEEEKKEEDAPEAVEADVEEEKADTDVEPEAEEVSDAVEEETEEKPKKRGRSKEE